MRAVLALLFLLAAWPAVAGDPNAAVVVSGCGTPPSAYAVGSTRGVTQDTHGNGCVTTTPSATTVQGFGTVSTSAIAVTDAAFTYYNLADGGTGSFAPASGQITVTFKNGETATGNAFVCLWGNSPTACTASNGYPVGPGASITRTISATVVPYLICDAASACKMGITR